MKHSPVVTPTDVAQQTAWRAYYETLRDHPLASTEQRQRATDMLAKTQLHEHAMPDTGSVEDFC